MATNVENNGVISEKEVITQQLASAQDQVDQIITDETAKLQRILKYVWIFFAFCFVYIVGLMLLTG